MNARSSPARPAKAVNLKLIYAFLLNRLLNHLKIFQAFLIAAELAAELHRHRAVLLDVGHGAHQSGPHPGAAHAAARHIAGHKALRMLPQIAVQAVHRHGVPENSTWRP